MLNTILTKMKSFAKDETGASAIEYAVMAALLIIVIAAAVGFLDLDTVFGAIGTNIGTATPGPGA